MKNTGYDAWVEEVSQDPEVQEALQKLEAAYLVARLRMKRGLTQAELADRVGTKQSSIARLENGTYEPRLSFLRKVIKALDANLELKVIDQAEEREKLSNAVILAQNSTYQIFEPIVNSFITEVESCYSAGRVKRSVNQPIITERAFWQ